MEDRRLVDVGDADRHGLGGGEAVAVGGGQVDGVGVVVVGVGGRLEVWAGDEGHRPAGRVDLQEARIGAAADRPGHVVARVGVGGRGRIDRPGRVLGGGCGGAAGDHQGLILHGDRDGLAGRQSARVGVGQLDHINIVVVGVGRGQGVRGGHEGHRAAGRVDLQQVRVGPACDGPVGVVACIRVGGRGEIDRSRRAAGRRGRRRAGDHRGLVDVGHHHAKVEGCGLLPGPRDHDHDPVVVVAGGAAAVLEVGRADEGEGGAAGRGQVLRVGRRGGDGELAGVGAREGEAPGVQRGGVEIEGIEGPAAVFRHALDRGLVTGGVDVGRGAEDGPERVKGIGMADADVRVGVGRRKAEALFRGNSYFLDHNWKVQDGR